MSAVGETIGEKRSVRILTNAYLNYRNKACNRPYDAIVCHSIAEPILYVEDMQTDPAAAQCPILFTDLSGGASFVKVCNTYEKFGYLSSIWNHFDPASDIWLGERI